MKKLTLSLDDIQVSGFEVVAPERDRKGTVQGAEAISRITYCDPESCILTCYVTTCIP
jgi:hypothetical protein